MNTLSISEAKMKLSALVDLVESTDEEVLITRNGRPVAVLVSPDEFDSWRETVAIRSNSEFMKEIRNGLKALEKAQCKLYSLEDLLNHDNH